MIREKFHDPLLQLSTKRVLLDVIGGHDITFDKVEPFSPRFINHSFLEQIPDFCDILLFHGIFAIIQNDIQLRHCVHLMVLRMHLKHHNNIENYINVCFH